MAVSDDFWVVDHDSNNGSLKTVHLNAFDPTGSFADNVVAEMTSHSDGTGMSVADAVTLLQQIATLLGVWAPGPAVGSAY